MQRHPSYKVLQPVVTKYPRAAGCLFQTYNDIVYGQSRFFRPDDYETEALSAQGWTDVQVLELEGLSRAAISGKKPKMDATLYVVPCSLAETLSFGWLQDAFTQLSDPPEIFLAITSDDASIVYYKLSRGIVKPQL
ncbi:Sen15 domain-containing protein [Mycena indigotica]|uniref:Sen15 domain-containing protein n=1 Tax=Mycena indigotica TaxID=2126181 RepID=A0A8H6W958_9AGAR|nr:Sen15 domain-containing protein [Mycena indigotica]KAF7306273.1 Sen15 domain-containing protein [Mycena indigotica]